MSNQKLETSVNVFNRIKSDANLNKNITHFTISYWDGVKKKHIDKPVEAFTPIDKGGEIPWTRVNFIKYKGKVIWDRETRYYDIEQCIEQVEYLPTTFSVMTYNVLSDIFSSTTDKYTCLKLNKRGENIISLIESKDCDIVILQEVTTKMKNLLKTLKRYCFYTELEGRNDVAIISKVSPVSSHVIKFSNKKEALINKFQINENKTITIVGFHASSDFRGDASTTRARQFNMIKQETEKDDIVIFAGDTNEIDGITQFDYMGRVLTEFTYNPQVNKFAEKTSKNQIPACYDRIYYSHNLELTHSEVIKEQLSDHYPVFSTFHYNDQYIHCNEIKVNTKCALVVIPEEVKCNDLDLKLKQYNPKWMPHINLLWPFIEMKDLIPYMHELNNITFDPLNVTITSYDYFEHEKNITLYMKLKDSDVIKLSEIREKFISVLPFISKSQKEKWIPHLSVETLPKSDFFDNSGVFSSEIFRKKVNFGTPINFQINNLFFISRTETETMRVNRIFPSSLIRLNGKNDEIKIKNLKIKVCDFLTNFCDSVEVCGSDRLYKIEDKMNGSDLDLCCFGKLLSEEFFAKVKKNSLECGLFYDCETVTGHMTGMRLRTIYFNVDIHYNDDDNIILPDAILKTVKDKEADFLNYYKVIRKVIEDGNIYGQVYGYLGSIHISILAARIVNSDEQLTDNNDILKKVLYILNEEPIISPKGNIAAFTKKDPSDNILIMTLDGNRNLVRTMNKQTLNTIKNVLSIYLGSEERYGVYSYSNVIHLKLKSNDNVILEKKQDKMNGHIRNFVITLNKSGNDARVGSRWTTTEENGVYCTTFSFSYNPNTNLFDHHLELFMNSVNDFMDDYTTFEYIKE